MTDLDKMARELLAAEWDSHGYLLQAAETRAGRNHLIRAEMSLSAIRAALLTALPGYALVPVDPTPEMVKAAEEAYMPFGDMELAIQMAIAASPKAGNKAVDADEEHCESRSPECGPVEHWDSEAVPLCAKCWAELQSAGNGTEAA